MPNHRLPRRWPTPLLYQVAREKTGARLATPTWSARPAFFLVQMVALLRDPPPTAGLVGYRSRLSYCSHANLTLCTGPCTNDKQHNVVTASLWVSVHDVECIRLTGPMRYQLDFGFVAGHFKAVGRRSPDEP